MTTITLTVTGAKAQAAVTGPLTSGMVGIPVTIEYDEAWNGLTKDLVCSCGKWEPGDGERRTIPDIGEAAVVAHEVMQAGMDLYLGVAGYSDDGRMVMPTTWAKCGRIQPGADTGAAPSQDPTLPFWVQLQADVTQLKLLAASDRRITDVVAAYLNNHPELSRHLALDATLAVSGAAADAKVVGDRLTQLADDCYVSIEKSVDTVLSSGTWATVDAAFGDVLNPISTIDQTESGVSEVKLWQGGNNLFKTPSSADDIFNAYQGGISGYDGENLDLYVTADNNTRILAAPLIRCAPGDVFHFSSQIADYTGTQNPVQPLMALYDRDGNVLTTGAGEAYIATYGAFLTSGKSFTVGNDSAVFARFGFRLKAGLSDFPTTSETAVRITNIMVSKGSALAYEPYIGKEYTADLGRTVYGGSLEWTTGKLTVTHDADGPLSVPQMVTLNGSAVTATSGTNYLFSSTGNTALVEYAADSSRTAPNAAIEYLLSLIAELKAELAQTTKFDPTRYNLPVLYLKGDTAAMTKNNAVDLGYVYGDLEGTCSVKWQGNSSLTWPKKNYTIKFDQAFEAASGWGAQKKYCLKANFIDHSHARNVVSAKLWGQVVKSRAADNTALNALPNAGAIDGFPVVIMLNGAFHGLYTFNIPKDGWMFGMGTGTSEAIVCADYHVDATRFKAAAALDGDFELEYVTDEDDAGWVLTSLNRMISAVMNSDGTDLDTTVAAYLDWDSVMDYYIFTALIGGVDMLDKNYILATYDGVKWFFSAYDMDTVYGNNWDGKSFISPADSRGIAYYADLHCAMNLVKTHKADALKARFQALTEGVLSVESVATAFTNFAAGIPSQILDADAAAWPTIPGTAVSNTDQICSWYRQRLAAVAAEIEAI